VNVRNRWTIAGLFAILAATVMAACGSDPEPAKAPRLPAAVADRLAGLSDETAAALEVGDDCAAQEAADELERESLEAEARIPTELRGELREAVQRLTAEISCEPEPVVITETVPEETTTEEEVDCPEDEKGRGRDEPRGPGREGPFGEDDPGRGHDREKEEGGDKEDDPCDDREDEGSGEDSSGEEGKG
jgi:hypothetical protein